MNYLEMIRNGRISDSNQNNEGNGRSSGQENKRIDRSPTNSVGTSSYGNRETRANNSSNGNGLDGSRSKERKPFNDDSSFSENTRQQKLAALTKKFGGKLNASRDSSETSLLTLISEKEAKDSERNLISSLDRYFEIFDQYLWEVGKDPLKIEIWSNADNEELGAIARTMLFFGKRDKMVASIVRSIINGNDVVTAATFFGLRIPKTSSILLKRK